MSVAMGGVQTLEEMLENFRASSLKMTKVLKTLLSTAFMCNHKINEMIGEKWLDAPWEIKKNNPPRDNHCLMAVKKKKISKGRSTLTPQWTAGLSR